MQNFSYKSLGKEFVFADKQDDEMVNENGIFDF